MKARLPKNEPARLEALRRYAILDTLAERTYDDITQIAAYVAQAPIAFISLVDRNRQWFKSRIGLAMAETPRDHAFCAHAILTPGSCLIVPDAREDDRFADNPLVTGGPKFRFYFGAPLVTPDHYPIGTLCVVDRVPRDLVDEEINALTALSRQVMSQLELTRHAAELLQAGADQGLLLAQLDAARRSWRRPGNGARPKA